MRSKRCAVRDAQCKTRESPLGHSGSRAFIPIGKYLHSLSLLLRLAPPNVNTLSDE